jgi:hypothetical protein
MNFSNARVIPRLAQRAEGPRTRLGASAKIVNGYVTAAFVVRLRDAICN